MQIETKLRQMLIFTLRGKGFELEPYLGQGLGGVLFFRRNLGALSEIRELTSRLKRAATHPLFLMIDQEGGITSQIPELDVPSNMALSAAGDMEAVYRSAAVIACGLRELGFNMNLAPVLDVQNNPDNPVIGVRSFGDDPQVVAKLAKVAVAGYQENGILACGKHFPGHGDTEVDTHQAMSISPHSLDRLRQLEWVPFRAAIEEGIGAIMTAHVGVATVDGDTPATLSPRIIGHLREELSFSGLVISDLMSMKAISSRYDPVDACAQAIMAGVDLLLVHDDFAIQQRVWDSLSKRVQTDRALASQVEEAHARIRYAKDNMPEPRSTEQTRVSLEQTAEEALIEYYQGESLRECVNRSTTVAVLSFRDNIPLESPTRAEEKVIELLRSLGKQAHLYREPRELPQVCDLYIILGTRRGPLLEESVSMLQSISKQKRVALAMSNPYLQHQLDFKAIVYTFGHNDLSLRAIKQYLQGRVEPKGTEPVRLLRK